MNPAQNALYWREWHAVVAACKAAGRPTPERAELHSWADAPASSKVFSRDDLTRVLEVFRRVSQPASLGAQMQLLKQRRAGVERIKKCLAIYLQGKPGAQAWAADRYVGSILADRFGGKLMDALDATELEQLRNTLAGAVQRKRKAAGHSVHEMRMLAGVWCDCAKCRQSAQTSVTPAPSSPSGDHS
jgi:hypothetical protein